MIGIKKYLDNLTLKSSSGSIFFKSNTDLGLKLLDIYPGAAAAYSLEALNSQYTGAIVQVRRDSDNTVLNIGFDGNELDVTTLSTFCSGANGFVTIWYDQSGNGYDVTQTIASRQPQIFDSVNGVVTINGKPAIYSNEDYLQNLTKSASASSTAYIVHKGDTSLASDTSVFSFPANGYSAHIGLFYWGTDVNKPLGFNSWNSDSFGYSNAEADFASHSIWTGLFKEGTITTNGVRLFKDGVEKSLSQVKGTSNNRTIEDGIYIGRGGTISGTQQGNGYYQEIVIYDNELANRLPIENNINDRYQIYWSGASQRLLDTYSGATAAYSLEAINAGYTGSIVQVRRDSDNTVLNIYANYDGSLNVDSLTTFCQGTDGFVTIWYDQSGNGNNATQTTASNQPKIYDSINGIELENGKPTIRWEVGQVQGLQATFSQVYAQPNTIISVHNRVINNGYLFDGKDSTNRHFQYSNLLSAGIDLSNAYPVAEMNKQNVLTAIFNTTNSESYINTELQASGNTGTNSLGGLTIGNRFNLSNTNDTLQGTIQEIIIYPTNETSNRAGIETNINNHYSIY